MNPDPNPPRGHRPTGRAGRQPDRDYPPATTPPDDPDITYMGTPSDALGEPGGPPGTPHASAPPTKGSGAPPRQPRSAVKFTRLAAAWWAVIVGSLFLIVLLVFIAQNMESIAIRFLGWTWHAPLGVSFLAASVCGSLITVMVGAARMIQLRRAAGKNLRKR